VVCGMGATAGLSRPMSIRGGSGGRGWARGKVSRVKPRLKPDPIRAWLLAPIAQWVAWQKVSRVKLRIGVGSWPIVTLVTAGRSAFRQ
jgi:hypothetical protein